jgi:hypothetical protein
VVQFAQGRPNKEEDVGEQHHFAMSVPDLWKTASGEREGPAQRESEGKTLVRL